MTALAALTVAALVSVRFVDFGRYRDRITGPLTKLTGREVRIDGGIRIHPGLSMRLVAEGVSFGNADWGSRPETATATRVAGVLRLLPLLRGEIEVAGIVIEGVELRSPAADSPVEITLEAESQGARVLVDGKSSPIADWASGDTRPTVDGSIEQSAAEPAVTAAGRGFKKLFGR